MDFYSNKIQKVYHDCSTEHINLTEEEWMFRIKSFCIQLYEKPIGNLLINKMTEFINRGYQIVITNKDIVYGSSYIYPKIRYDGERKVIITMPSVPYFVEVEVINMKKIEHIDDEDLLRVSRYEPSWNELSKSSKYNYTYNCVKYEKLPQIIGFAHELIHALRFFERINMDGCKEEEKTIYGILTKTLNYNIDGEIVHITENMIRKDFGFEPRVSHEAQELYCYDVPRTYDARRYFTKEDFFK
jgi:hypothetical protein